MVHSRVCTVAGMLTWVMSLAVVLRVGGAEVLVASVELEAVGR